LSAYVVNTSDFFVGIVEFLLINAVIIPPAVSIPKVKGVTSNNNKSLTVGSPYPVKIAA